MADKLDKSLGEIIASRPRGNRRGGNTNSAKRHIVGGARTGSPMNRPRPAGGAGGAPAGKIIISNLPPDVTDKDVTELFSTTVGPVSETTLNYDSNGRSKGSATVTFARPGDATKAYNQYNNRLIDGKRTLKIEIVVDPTKAAPAASLAERVGGPDAKTADGSRPPRNGNAGKGRGGGRGGGRGRGPRRNERPQKTAADLDAEMEDYAANNEEPAAPAAVAE
ncbi:hypothetical protein FRC03_001019 [Tulasnella sp. 419]|nr:hypothetical protein FRC02_009113 [Tulasnella sp. 418]KAG8947534.1 hypothetical protein FRC03_001019 [Tulasnella sp. 419]